MQRPAQTNLLQSCYSIDRRTMLKGSLLAGSALLLETMMTRVTAAPSGQLYAPGDYPNFSYPSTFRLTVPETSANAQYRAVVPSPAPPPWRFLGDFCVPKDTPNPLYNGLRVLPLSWMLHFKSNGAGSGGAAKPAQTIAETTGVAIDLGKALGKDLTPFAQKYGTPEPLYYLWAWTKPTGGEWDEYEFCAAVAENLWRVPKEGGYRVQIGFGGTSERSLQFVIGGGNQTSPGGNLDIAQVVWYLLVHKDDKAEALQRGLAGVCPPSKA